MIYHLKHSVTNDQDLLCTLFNNIVTGNIMEGDVVKMVRVSEADIGICEKVFPEQRLWMHYLWGVVAIKLKLNGTYRYIIRKIGGCIIDTFLLYIHEIIDEITKGWEQKNVTKILFHNVEGSF